MARAAGDGRNYSIGIVDTKGRLVEELDAFPSVTTIIGATDSSKTNALMGWAYNLGMEGVSELLKTEKIKPGHSAAAIKQKMKAAKLTPWSTRDNAAKRGSGVHEWVEKCLLGQTTTDDFLKATPEDEQGYARAAIKWLEQYDRAVIATERVMVHLDRRYAGTVDLIDEKDGAIRVSDFKTSKAIYPIQFVQGTAYAQAWEHMNERRATPQPVDSISVIRFGANGDFEERVQPYEGARVFNAMRALYAELEGS